MRIKKEENKLLFIENGEPLDEKISLITSATFPALDKIIEHKRKLQFELELLETIHQLIQANGLEKVVRLLEDNEELTPAVVMFLMGKLGKS